MSSTRGQNMANFCPLTAQIGSGVWGTPSNFNGFHVLPSLLQRRRSQKANFAQCLAISWAGTLCIHFRGLLPLTEFCLMQYSLYVQVLHSPILAALLHGTPAADVSQTLWHGTRTGITELSQRAPPILGRRPSRWASAHILVLMVIHLHQNNITTVTNIDKLFKCST